MVEPLRKFKRVNLLGLDFYVDWLDLDGKCTRIISIKEVYSGRIFVYKDVAVAGKSFEDMVLEAIGVEKYVETVAEQKVEAPAAQETEQPKENTIAKKAKRSNKPSKE